MKTTNVAIVNGITLQVVADEREQLVAVKPVCEILGVNYPGQFTKLKEHPLYGSVIELSPTTGADGKAYDMVCLPLRYFPSWLFSINPNNVKEDIRENLLEYQLKCNDVLFDYFFRRTDFAMKKEEKVNLAREAYEDSTEEVRLAKSRQTLAKTNFDKALAWTFEDYDAERQQLSIPGFE